MKNLIIGILVLPFLVYGGVKGAIWYKTKEDMDKLVQATAPFVDISYESITSSLLDKQISVNQINLIIKKSGDKISIEKIAFSSDDLLTLLLENNNEMVDAKGRMKVKQAVLDFRGVMVDINSETANQFLLSQNSKFNLDALACGEVSTINSEALQAMGYSSLVADTRIGFTFLPAEQAIKMNINSGIRDMYGIALNANIFLGVDNLSPSNMINVVPKLSQMSFTFIDQSYIQRQKAFCANQLNVSETEYVSVWVDTFERALSLSGIVVGPKVHEALTTFYTNPSTLAFEVNPHGPIELEYLDVYNPKDLVEWIGLDIYYNDHKLPELDVIWNTKSLAASGLTVPKWSDKAPEDSRAVQTESLVADPQAKIVEPIKLPKKRFRVTPFEALPKYIGHKVLVGTQKGDDYRGTLKSADSQNISISIVKNGGQAVLPLPKDGIREVQVYY